MARITVDDLPEENPNRLQLTAGGDLPRAPLSAGASPLVERTATSTVIALREIATGKVGTKY